MSGIPTLVKEEPSPGGSDDGNSVDSHSLSICISAIKKELDADLPMERESCTRFLPLITSVDNVLVKEEWIEDVESEELGSSVNTPACSVNPSCGLVIKVESCQVCKKIDDRSVVDVKQVNSKNIPRTSRTSFGGMGRCSTVEFKEELESMQGNHDEEQSFTCYTCSKSFKWKRYLIDHMRLHTGKRPYKCEVCKSRFSRAGNLKEHKRTHTGVKPFFCDICESTFSRAGNLKEHKRIHSGEKPFMCDVCKTRFGRARQLKEHKRTHTGEKPYLCDVCESRFSNAGNLKKHKRIHTGEKPFVCDVCESRFSQNGTLKKHKRTHTGEEPFVSHM